MILVLTAGFGDGHNTAARNVAEALQRLEPEEEAKVVDVFDEAHPFLSPAMKSGYQMLITRAPWLWAAIFRHSSGVKFEGGTVDALNALRKAIARLLKRFRPRAIVCSYPVYAKLVRDLAESGESTPPVFTVITDSITIHPIWMLAPSDWYFVADEDSEKSLVKLGADATRVRVTGFPVSLSFLEKPTPEECATPKGSILYLPSTGVNYVSKTLDALRPLVAAGVKLTIPVGKHASRLHLVITHYLDSLPGADIEILGWTKRIPRLLQTHDVVICKAGGAILHEALAATCPAIIDYVVPGQEEGNAELLTKHGCGVTTQSPRQTGQEAARLLADGAKVAKEMKARMVSLNEAESALRIAGHIREVLGK